jgi:hypothetical protein
MAFSLGFYRRLVTLPVHGPIPGNWPLEHFTLACIRQPACGFAGLRLAASTTRQVAYFTILALLVLGDG